MWACDSTCYCWGENCFADWSYDCSRRSLPDAHQRVRYLPSSSDTLRHCCSTTTSDSGAVCETYVRYSHGASSDFDWWSCGDYCYYCAWCSRRTMTPGDGWSFDRSWPWMATNSRVAVDDLPHTVQRLNDVHCASTERYSTTCLGFYVYCLATGLSEDSHQRCLSYCLSYCSNSMFNEARCY